MIHFVKRFKYSKFDFILNRSDNAVDYFWTVSDNSFQPRRFIVKSFSDDGDDILTGKHWDRRKTMINDYMMPNVK